MYSQCTCACKYRNAVLGKSFISRIILLFPLIFKIYVPENLKTPSFVLDQIKQSLLSSSQKELIFLTDMSKMQEEDDSPVVQRLNFMCKDRNIRAETNNMNEYITQKKS